MATSFFIRKKDSERATLFLRARSRKNGIDIKASTLLTIDVKEWGKAQASAKDLKNLRKREAVLFGKLDQIEKTVDTMLELNSTVSTELINEAVFSIINAEQIKAEEDREEARKESAKENLNQYIARYIDDIKAGKRLTKKNTVYAKGTIHNRISFQSEFNKFQEEANRTFDFNDITIDFYNDFVGWFNRKGYSPNTTGKHIKSLKFILSEAREENLHNNTETQRKAFKTLTAEADTVYLTRAEITAIENLNDKVLTASQRISRDIFLTGVYIAQRYSDYHRITPENIIQLGNGKNAIRMRQQKTGAKVVIPVSTQLETILKKYGYLLPITNSQTVNEDIKLICRKAGITQKIEHKANRGAMVITEYVEKCSLISTHTARRTGATLMYLEGLDTISIMKITGHRTEKEFKKYIRVNEEENAIILSNSDFFNKPIVNIK